jgi:hypothetical protein
MQELNKKEQGEIIELKDKLSRLKKNEQLVYYSGITPNYYTGNLVREKFKTVMAAYAHNVAIPVQRRIGCETKGSRILGVFDYIAVGK